MDEIEDSARRDALHRRADRARQYMSELRGRFGNPNRATGAKWAYDQNAGEVWAWERLAGFDLSTNEAALSAIDELEALKPSPPQGVQDPADFERWRLSALAALRREFATPDSPG